MRTTSRKIGAFVAAAAIAIVAIALVLGTRSGNEATTTAPASATTTTSAEAPDAAAANVAMSFMKAYGALDAERAIGYLADDADIAAVMSSVGAQGIEGTLDEFRLFFSMLAAQGYKHMPHACEELGTLAAGTMLRCPFDFHTIRSDELGLGPFGGSYFQLTVRDGEIVRASKTWETQEFSPQVWEPFATWVSKRYPQDAAVMYTGSGSGVRLTEESVRLWGKRSREYVEAKAPGR